jgi:acyl dehydratase
MCIEQRDFDAGGCRVVQNLYFEDIQTGDIFGSREVTVTVDREEMLDYAGRYDALPIHVDVAAARNASLEDVIASGGHTSSLMLRLYHLNCRHAKVNIAIVVGVDWHLKFHKPVYAGDVLCQLQTALETRASSRPGHGTVVFRGETAVKLCCRSIRGSWWQHAPRIAVSEIPGQSGLALPSALRPPSASSGSRPTFT